ncbi:hypothetical protein AAVH_27291 [Aphelenchoides avenae]|nr:hypothetical protein AAVH_27291 [Aphelenchus avenae]
MFQAQQTIDSFEHPFFVQYPYRRRRHSKAWDFENNPGLVPTEADIDFRRVARFYPKRNSTFEEHLICCSHTYKAFAVENASDQRIFIVASINNARRNGIFRLQRVGFLSDVRVSVLRA